MYTSRKRKVIFTGNRYTLMQWEQCVKEALIKEKLLIRHWERQLHVPMLHHSSQLTNNTLQD